MRRLCFIFLAPHCMILAAHLPGLQTLARNITASRTIRRALNIFKLSLYHTPKRTIWQRWRYSNRGMIKGSKVGEIEN
jgi:hypothetical protein